MPDKDYFIVYHYEFDTTNSNDERYHDQGVHIFTSSATTRWGLYMEHIQNRRERGRQMGNPWSPVPRLIVHTFDAKVNKLT